MQITQFTKWLTGKSQLPPTRNLAQNLFMAVRMDVSADQRYQPVISE
jgi:hypothetical protein